MHPVNALDELFEEGGRETWRALAVTAIIHVYRPHHRHVLREELPQGHPPDTVARYNASLVQFLPYRVGVRKHSRRGAT